MTKRTPISDFAENLRNNSYFSHPRELNLPQTRTDILSGLTVALALVPEAVAFAFVAGVDPLVGLYAAFIVGLITAAFGGLDISVNNAGIVAPSGRIHNVSPEDFRQVLDVNLMGIFNTMKASIIAMRGAGGGSVVNTASVAGFTNWTHNSPYGASKAAVIQLTKIAAAEYANDQIRVNCVSPGTFVTSFHDDLPAGAMDGVLARHPLGRFGETPEIASAYVYLASDQTSWVTGTNLVFDGGMSVSQ